MEDLLCAPSLSSPQQTQLCCASGVTSRACATYDCTSNPLLAGERSRSTGCAAGISRSACAWCRGCAHASLFRAVLSPSTLISLPCGCLRATGSSASSGSTRSEATVRARVPSRSCIQPRYSHRAPAAVFRSSAILAANSARQHLLCMPRSQPRQRTGDA